MATCRQCNGVGYIGSISSGVEGGHTCGTCGGSGTTHDYSDNSLNSNEKRTIKPLPKAVMVASSIIAGFWALLYISQYSNDGEHFSIGFMIGVAVTTGLVWAVALLVFNLVHKVLPKFKSNSRGSLFIEVILLMIIPIVVFNIIL